MGKNAKNNYQDFKRYLNHVCKYHDASYTIYNNSIYIYGEKSTFFVNIPRKLDFNKLYKFMHKNNVSDEWHVQGTYKMKYGIFLMASHDFNNKYRIPIPDMEDLYRFCEDYDKLRKYNIAIQHNKNKMNP